MVKNKSVQPEVTIGLVGHIDNGKTTLVSKLTGKWTDTHSEELKRGITIKLGYANASFYYCDKCRKYITKEDCECREKAKFLRKVSFVDAPGHESLMATMLTGTAIIDGALLLVSANENCPQPQTAEHLMALDMAGIKQIVIVQNKIDLVAKEEAVKNYQQIKEFVKDTIAENAPIIPVSAQHNVNMNELIEAIENTIKTPKRDLKKDPLMLVARSFDINRPGTEIEKLRGGVLGGVIKQGILKVGDKIQISPGREIEKHGKKERVPITTTIKGLEAGGELIKEAGPGGSIGILTELDPFYVKSDGLAGNVVGYENKLPLIRNELTIKPELLKRFFDKEDSKIGEIKKGEWLMLNVNAAATVGLVEEIKKGGLKLRLKIPVCANNEDHITISRRIGTRWRLIGVSKIY